MTLDIEKLRAENPLLDGVGMIPVVDSGQTIGMQPELLANELLNDGAHVFTHLHGQSCWRVTPPLGSPSPLSGRLRNERLAEIKIRCHGAALWSQCGVGIRAPLEGRHIGA
ncbi:hypothetical protein K6Y56_31520, partial [Burkholderia cenocepacia]|nr:hypothetical protein [Burkholderia cenocepacia]MCW3685211.1 hypothetical protein [Burkholderia cenocepacia]